MANNIDLLSELYQFRRDQRGKRLLDFYSGRGDGFLIFQSPSLGVYNNCNTVGAISSENLKRMAKWLALDWTDDLPFMEPWLGTGVYANAFGCEYHWRENTSPCTHYKYHGIDEVAGLSMPDWRQSPIMRMVLETIDLLKEETDGKLPIALTDTQSPFDTATLILDAAEFFASCYEEPEIVRHFMDIITDLLIEFSRVQMERIGQECLATPGHIAGGLVGGRGISISDDNLAVSSPEINERFALPANDRIGEAFGGVAIHSCGVWSNTMPLLKKYRHINMVDCAILTNGDPNPNRPEDVRDALAGSGITVKARVGGNPEKYLPVLSRVAHPNLRLIVEIPYDEANARENYLAVKEVLEGTFAQAQW